MSRKRPQRSPDWSIVFEDASALRAVVDAVATVMTRVSFKVCKIKGAYFLSVDSADVAFVCCVSARLQLDKVTFHSTRAEEECRNEEEGFNFCVDCKHVSSAIDTPSCAHLSLTMEGHMDDAKIVLKMLDPETHTHEVCSELSTYLEEPQMSLQSMDFKTTLEVDLTHLREMIKKSRKAHAEHLQIRIFLKTLSHKNISLVTFSIDGDFYHEQKFCHETTRDEDGSMVVRAAADGSQKLMDASEDEPFFKASFPIEKIENFVKNLPCKMLAAQVGAGMPILLNYPLGGASDDSSHIRFLIAPVNEEE